MQPRSPLPRLLAPALLALAMYPPAGAQTGAGPLLEETRRPAPPALPSQTPPRVLEVPVRPAINMPEGVSVTVSSFRVNGAQSFPVYEL